MAGKAPTSLSLWLERVVVLCFVVDDFAVIVTNDSAIE